MSTKTWAMILLISIVSTAVFTRYYFPQTVEKIVTIEKEVIVTHTRVVKTPDGTTTTETTTTDTDIKKTTDVKSAVANWFITAGMQYQLDRSYYYSLSVNRRVLGPIFIGVNGSTNKTIGISLGVEF